MSSARTHLNSMLDLLTSECLQAQVHIRIWKRLKAFADRSPEPASLRWYSFFFWATSKAHAETALSHLFRLIDKSGSGVHVGRLLTYVASHPELCDASGRSELSRQIREDRKRLAALTSTIARLHKQRDKYFAHLSREYLAKPERQVLRDYAVGPDAVSDLLEQLAAIINAYSGLFRDSTTLMLVVGEEGKVDYLLDQLETAAQERIAPRGTRRSDAYKPLQPTRAAGPNSQRERAGSGPRG